MFDASTAFRLPSSAVRSATAAFVTEERWQTLTNEQRKGFPPLCPDFIIELRSPTDSTATSHRKIQYDWMANGCQLAWLIDPDPETVYIFRADGSEEKVHGFDQTLSGESVLSGLAFQLSELWIVWN